MIVSDKLVPVSLRSLRHVVVDLIISTTLIVVVILRRRTLPRQVGRQDVFCRQPVKVFEVYAEDQTDNDGDDEKNSPVHERGRGPRRLD